MEGKKSVLNPINFNRVHTKMHKVFFLNYHICEQFILKLECSILILIQILLMNGCSQNYKDLQSDKCS